MSQGGDRNNLPNWLRQMAGSEDTPDWLIRFIEQTGGVLQLGELDGELAEMGFQPADVLPSRSPGATEEPTAPSDAEATADGWLDSLEVPEESAFAAPIPDKEPDVADWLSGMQEDVAAPAPPVEAEAPSATGEADVPDWLSGLDDLVSQQAATSEESAASEDVAPSEGIDWLDELDSDVPVETAPSPPSPLPEEEAAPEWLSGLDAGVPAGAPEEEEPSPALMAEEEEAPDWLTGLSEGAPTEVGLPSVPASEEAVPDWLSGLDAGVPAGAPEEEAPSPAPLAGEEEAPDWLTGLSEGAPTEVGLPSAPASEEVAPDWLSGLDAEVPAGAPEEEEPSPAPMAEEEEAPDWLTGLDAEALAGVPTEGELPSVPASEEAVPDWLSGLDAEVPAGAPEEEEPSPAPLAGEEEVPDWLTGLDAEVSAGAPEEIPSPTAPVERRPDQVEGVPDWLATIDMSSPSTDLPSALPAGEPSAQAAPADEDALPDWLGEVEASVEAEAEPEEGLPDWLTSAVQEGAQPGEQQALPDEAAVSRQLPGGETAPEGQDAGPDWLRDMGDVTAEPQPEPQKGVTAWLQDVQEMPVPEGDLTRETPEEAPDVLPDWLHVADEEHEDIGLDIPTEMPDWLREIPPEEEPTQELPTPQAEPPVALPAEQAGIPGTPSWMEDIEAPEEEMPVIADVFDLPTRAELPAVETPDWLADLRKGEGAPAHPEEELPVETSGPLAGLRGVLNPEPLLAILPKSTYKPSLPIPNAHQAEANLIKDVLEPVAPAIPVASPGRQVMAGLGRWLVYLVLAVVIFAAPIRGIVLPVEMVETESFTYAIDGLPEGSTVLLVIDYDASLDGELTPQMRAIVWHLLQRNLGIVTVSLSPQGSALVQGVFREKATAVEGQAYVNLGYLPPHPASVRAFTDNPFGGVTLWATTPNAAQTPLGQQVRQFDDLDLIIAVSGDRDHVRWWVEQVGSQKPVDIVAAVSASVAPYIQPYYDEKGRGQIKGMLVGLAAVPQYERLTGTGVTPSAWENYIVQVNAQLLLVAFVLLGAAASLLKNLSKGRSGGGRHRRTSPDAPAGEDEDE